MQNKIEKVILEKEDIKNIIPDRECLRILTIAQAHEMQTVVFDKDEVTYHIVTTNQLSDKLQLFLSQIEKKHLKYKLYYTSLECMEIAYSRYSKEEAIASQQQKIQQKQQEAHGTHAIAMIKSLFEKRQTLNTSDVIMEFVRLSFQAGASDVHFQPEEKGIFMKLRIDGVLQDIVSFTHKDFYPYLKKLKFIAGTKMNVEYIPQDGRFSVQADDKKGGLTQIDVRANFMPGKDSESTVLRFLDGTHSIQSFDDLGFWGRNKQVFEKGLHHNFGLILITGPTGSGKTTTLYSVLNTKNTGTHKIITLEDPIEYQLDGIQQSQINYKKGYDYVQGLNACMRHDPDIILVGETRTVETAETVINAALTGHLVFSTIHTNSAIEAVTRLLSMGIKGYLLAPSLLMIEAQRLVRKVCPHCVKKQQATASETAEITHILDIIKPLSSLPISFDGTVPVAHGCDKCQGIGYKGRIAVMEVLEINEEIRDAIIQGAPSKQIFVLARKNNFMTLQEDAYVKMLQGYTTFDELRRVV